MTLQRSTHEEIAELLSAVADTFACRADVAQLELVDRSDLFDTKFVYAYNLGAAIALRTAGKHLLAMLDAAGAPSRRTDR